MSRFSSHWRTVSGVFGGFSAGAAVSVLLLRQFDTQACTQATTTAAAPTDQLFQVEPKSANADSLCALRGPELSQRKCYDEAIQACRDLVLQTKEEMGIPGVCVAVNVDGKTAWTEGFGFSDVENGVPCTSKTIMRIASISKSLTVTALAKLLEEGKIDLDLPVQHYVPQFPKKIVNGKSVEITTRMLLSHLSGIRHWKGGENTNPPTESSPLPEFYSNTVYKSVEEALGMFASDDLMHKPGSKYLYSSPAWTLVSAVMEKAAGITYREIMTDLCNQLGLRQTKFDENSCITLNRARYYTRNKKGRLINSPCVDNSCKWAGGGFQSSVGDLVKFGDVMLYCYQEGHSSYLQKDTIDALWTISPLTLQKPKGLGPTSGYGMGWVITPALTQYGGVEPQTLSINHTGGAVGASSVLLIVPHKLATDHVPSGVTVAITVNLQEVGLTRLAHEISKHFWRARTSFALLPFSD